MHSDITVLFLIKLLYLTCIQCLSRTFGILIFRPYNLLREPSLFRLSQNLEDTLAHSQTHTHTHTGVLYISLVFLRKNTNMKKTNKCNIITLNVLKNLHFFSLRYFFYNFYSQLYSLAAYCAQTIYTTFSRAAIDLGST